MREIAFSLHATEQCFHVDVCLPLTLSWLLEIFILPLLLHTSLRYQLDFDDMTH